VVSLRTRHTFGINAKADAFHQVRSIDELKTKLEMLKQPFWILGEGSNTVFIDDYHGAILHPCFKGIQIQESVFNWKVVVKAGENWHELVTQCMQKGIDGFENLALIPGSVGAAPIQNIGAYGVEVAKYVDWVDCIEIETGEALRLSAQDCEFGYRDSVFKKDLYQKVVIHQVCFSISKDWCPVHHYGELQELESPTAQQIYERVVQIRRSKLPDPVKVGNAGSFFKNPVVSTDCLNTLKKTYENIPFYLINAHQAKLPAAWLIEQCGFKQRSKGKIGSYFKQPLVLVNNGNGRGDDLLSFAREIRDEVLSQFSVRLENEVNLIGRDGRVTL
jgi:UDP-N-acetylmuramate dehydrogenase